MWEDLIKTGPCIYSKWELKQIFKFIETRHRGREEKRTSPIYLRETEQQKCVGEVKPFKGASTAAH